MLKECKKKRDDDINKKKIEETKPGSGKIWNSKPKKYNMDYDYTKHQISKSNNLNRSKSKQKIDNNKNDNLEKKYNNMDKEKYYEGIYKKNNNFNTDNIYDNDKNDNILFTQAIEYGKALDILHNELLSIDLLEDEFNE